MSTRMEEAWAITPTEPIDLGAVVNDDQGCRWVRCSSMLGLKAWVNDDALDSEWRAWRDITAPRVLSQGMASGKHEPPYPYRTDALERLHPDGWQNIKPRSVRVADLTPTQPTVTLDRLRHLLGGGAPETDDPFPHVVAHEGHLYVHDGHHRYAIALCSRTTLRCRVVDELGDSA